MTDNEIKKALECCIDCDCTDCPCNTIEGCKDIDYEATLDLINRQKAELDDLKRDDLPRCKDALRRANEIGIDLEKENKELKAEVEKLELLNAVLLESCNGYSKACDTYKAEIERSKTECGLAKFDKYKAEFEEFRAEIKAEAIKEFEDKIKDEFDKHGVDYTAYVIVDDVAREVAGDN